MKNVSCTALRGQKGSIADLPIVSAAKILLLMLPVILGSCLSGSSTSGSGAAVPLATCQVPFTKLINPINIQGHKQIYFSVDDLAFLLNNASQIQSVELDMQVSGKHEGDPSDVSISFDGLTCTAASSEPYNLPAKYDAQNNDSELGFSLHKMKLNGATPVTGLMTNIVKNKGEVKITAQGQDINVTSAQIVVQGTNFEACPNPPPPPPPPPAPTAPHTLLGTVTPSGSPVSSTQISIQFSSDQAGVSFQCSLDSAAATACTSPQTYSGLANGSHTFNVVATNSYGLTDPTGASYSWTVDTIPPNVVITNAASLPSLTNQTSISLQFTADGAVSFACALDSGAQTSCQSPANYAGLSEGVHSVSIWATDAAGNVSTSPAVFQWTIDLTPPVTSFVDIEPAATISNVVTKSFVFAANETATFECSLDQASFASCTSPASFDGLLEGQHSFSVRSTDAAGNLGSTVSYSWTIDLTPPVVSLGQFSPPQGITNAKLVSVEFSADEAATFYCSFDGTPASLCTSPAMQSVSTEGPHDFEVYAVDTAGNQSAPVDLSWTMDFTAPQIAWASFVPSAATYINSTSFSASVSTTEPTIFSWLLNSLGLAGTDSTMALQNLAEGSYDLSVSGSDAAQNVSNVLDHTFIVDLTPPEVTLQAELSGGVVTNRTDNSFTFDANEDSTFECQLDGAGYSSCSSPLLVSGLAEGAHEFDVRATDLAGNLGNSVNAVWTVDLTPPITSITAAQTSTFAYTFTITANEPIQSTECSMDGQAWASCTSPVTYSGLSVGPHAFSARTTDIAGNVNQAGTSISFTVASGITTSIASMNPATSPNNSTQIVFGLAASQSPATFMCSLDQSALISCASSVTYTNLSEGSHVFKAYAVDQYGTMDATGASYSWMVDLTPPTTTLTPQRTANASISFSFTANEAGSTFICSLDGAAMSACTSPVSYSGLAQGSHSFVVKATDIAGNTSPSGSSYSWTVSPPTTTSIVSTNPATNLTNSTSMSVSFTSNTSGATFVCSWDGAAATACTSPSSKSGLASGSHTFSVWAIDSWGTQDPTGATFNWTIDTTPPVVSNLTATVTSTSMKITWTTNKPATSKLNWGQGTGTNIVVPEDSNYVTSHAITVVGLVPGTTYSYFVSGHDKAGNAYSSTVHQTRTNP